MKSSTKYLVYPGHGVCELLSVENKKTELGQEPYLNLKLLSSGMKILVPEKNVFSLGIRKLVSPAEASAAFVELQNYEASSIKVSHLSWNRRYREAMEKIKSSNFKEMVELAITLKKLKFEKDLSFGELKMLDVVTEQLELELSTVLNQKIELFTPEPT